MAERSLSFGLPVTSGECSKMHSKCTSCDDLERAVVHTSTNSSCEISCTINFIVPLLIKTDRVSFCKTVCCQCKIEILLIGKFIRINTCRKGKPGTKFLGVWREGDCCGLRVMWFCCFGGDVWLLFVHLWWGFFKCMDLHMFKWCYSFCVCRSYHLTKEQEVYVTRNISWRVFFLILCWLYLVNFYEVQNLWNLKGCTLGSSQARCLAQIGICFQHNRHAFLNVCQSSWLNGLYRLAGKKINFYETVHVWKKGWIFWVFSRLLDTLISADLSI